MQEEIPVILYTVHGLVLGERQLSPLGNFFLSKNSMWHYKIIYLGPFYNIGMQSLLSNM